MTDRKDKGCNKKDGTGGRQGNRDGSGPGKDCKRGLGKGVRRKDKDSGTKK